MIRDAPPALFDFFPQRGIEIHQVDEQVSSDGGLVVFRELDQKLRLTETFTQQIEDGRSDPDQSLLSVIRQRVFGILAGYEDQNDHDTLRSDPVFKLLADRTPEDRDLASQPTISRVENAVTPADLLRLEDWFIDRFVESFDERPNRITLDIDTFADDAHGAQQLTFFNNFYKKNIYQVCVITSSRTKSRVRHCSRRCLCTRLMCDWSMWTSHSNGMVAATSLEPRPKPCGESSSRTHVESKANVRAEIVFESIWML